jgi:D-sedoheptulose 7-phosphate isomerase
MSLSATSYLHALSDAFRATEVTDRQGRGLGLDEGTSQAVELLLRAGASGKKVLLVGNGGSAAIVSHMQNDLCKAVGVRALVFTEQPLLTAISNDDGYERSFERPTELWADAGDVLIAVSSSGKSANILRAAKAASLRGARVVTFSGFLPDNPLRTQGDLNFWVPSKAYGYVEVAHQGLGHCITDLAVRAQHKGAPPPGFP